MTNLRETRIKYLITIRVNTMQPIQEVILKKETKTTFEINRTNIKKHILGYINLSSKGTKEKEKRELVYIPEFKTMPIDISSYKYLLKLQSTDWDNRYSFVNVILNNPFIKELHEETEKFINKYPNFTKNQMSQYRQFEIPKRTPGEMRTVSEPLPELKELQIKLKFIFENILKIKAHECAHAYIKRRSDRTNAERHQYSNHIVKMDISKFFDNLNVDKIIEPALLNYREFAILQTIPEELSTETLNKQTNFTKETIKKIQEYHKTMRNLLDDLKTIMKLENGIPQGSVFSPMLCNLTMLPYDFKIETALQNIEISKNFVMYTRYADDLFFSSTAPIQKDHLTEIVQNIITPLQINTEKTKYMKTTGRCYVTGIKINRENELSYGAEKKDPLIKSLFKIMLIKYKYYNGEIKENINKTEMQIFLGQLAYAQNIEPIYFQRIIQKYCAKFEINTAFFYKWMLGDKEQQQRYTFEPL